MWNRVWITWNVSGGFLLGEAVEGAEAPDEVDGVDADDFAVGEAGGDGVEGVAVVGVVEGGDEDEPVGDVEVGVAGGEALAFEEDGCGHGEGERSRSGSPSRGCGRRGGGRGFRRAGGGFRRRCWVRRR